MKMKCIGIGKTVGAYGLEKVQIYVKRIQRFIPFEWVELKEFKHHKNNPATALQAEEDLILKHVSGRDALILFNEKGKLMSSKAFAQFMGKHNMTHGGPSILPWRCLWIWRFFAQTCQWNSIFIPYDVSTPTSQSSCT